MALFNYRMRRIPKASTEDRHGIIYVLCGLSVAIYFVLHFAPFTENNATRRQMLEASRLMLEALDIVGQCRQDSGLTIDDAIDPNRTGLIGSEFSALTTSRGDIHAKRTTTNPNMAALIAYLLKKTKLNEGDLVAVGASGSFPGLIIATHAAAKAMRLRPLPIYSIGASQWGANEPEFTWLHIEQCLLDADWLDVEPLAISLGGENDTGEGWSQEARSSVTSGITSRGSLLLQERDLERNVSARMKLYGEGAAGHAIRAFVNIGGASANLGESPLVLELQPGLNDVKATPEGEERGVLFEMADRAIPIIHLLYIRGLAERYGLPWDPKPLPAPGEGGIYQQARLMGPVFRLLCALYLILLGCILTFWLRQTLSRRPTGH